MRALTIRAQISGGRHGRRTGPPTVGHGAQHPWAGSLMRIRNGLHARSIRRGTPVRVARMPGCLLASGPPTERNGPPNPFARASGSAGRTRSAPSTTDQAPTSRCSPASPRASSCACSMRPSTGWPRCASSSPRSMGTAGTPTCPTPVPVSTTAIGCTGRGTRPRACGATRPSCCSTRTPSRSTGRSTGTSPASRTSSTTPTGRTPPTARRTCLGPSSATRSSTGATTDRRRTRCTRRSSTRPTSVG